MSESPCVEHRTRGAARRLLRRDPNALFHAACMGRTDDVEVLLDQGAAVDGNGRTHNPLHAAIQHNRTSTARLLLARGARIQPRSIVDASSHGNLVIVSLLVAHGCSNVFFGAALCGAAGAGHTDVVRFLVAHGADPTTGNHHPIRRAAWYGHTSTVIALLEYGPTGINCALGNAVFYQHHELVQLLLARGADPRVLNRTQRSTYRPAVLASERAVLDLARRCRSTGALRVCIRCA